MGHTHSQPCSCVANAKSNGGLPNVLRRDPTRTVGLRRRFQAEIVRRLNNLKKSIWNLVVEEDAFGLKPRSHNPMVGNAEPSYASVQANITDPTVLKLLQGIRNRIDTDDVLKFEKQPHITVRYGFTDDDPTQAQQVIKDIGVVRAKLGKLSVFELPDAEVLKLEVDSKDLHRAHKKLELLPHVDTHPNYQPHLTIAYLKPGTAHKYLFMATGLDGYELEFDELVFSSSGRERESVAVNENPKGCNQYTGPGCGVGDLPDDVDNPETWKRFDASGKKLHDLYHVTESYNLGSIKKYGLVSGYQSDIASSMLSAPVPTKRVFVTTSKQQAEVLHRQIEDSGGSPVTLHLRLPSKVLSKLDPRVDPGVEESLALKPSSSLVKMGLLSIRTKDNNSVPKDWTDRIAANSLVTNQRFAFQTSAEQTEAFRRWLANEVELQMFGTLEEQIKDAWWRGYIEEGYKQGAGRAFDDTKRPYAKGYAQDESTSDFYRGTKEQFLRSAFAQPVSVDKVKLLAGRVYTDIKGVTDVVATKVQRSLTDGIIEGKSPREVGREMNDVLDAYKNQATTVARTETIRAHAEGQLDAMEKLGVEDVGVAVEWSTSGLGVTALGNPSPCPLCAPLQGIVMKVKEARGLIPRHPNCMCSLVPANVGEDTSGQLRSAASIKGAFRKSIKAEIPRGSKRTIAQQKAKSSWKGADKSIGKKRPKGMVGNTTTPHLNLLPTESQLLQQQLALTMLDLALNG